MFGGKSKLIMADGYNLGERVESKIDKLVDAVSGLDKTVSVSSEKITNVTTRLERHEKNTGDYKVDTKKAIDSLFSNIRNAQCPESGAIEQIKAHERDQNGKIDLIQNSLHRIENSASTKAEIKSMTLRIVAIGVSLFMALIAFLKYIQ